MAKLLPKVESYVYGRHVDCIGGCHLGTPHWQGGRNRWRRETRLTEARAKVRYELKGSKTMKGIV